jgi:hypothetical protein
MASAGVDYTMRLISSILFVLLTTTVLVGQTTKPAEIPTSEKDRKPHPATQPGEVLETTLEQLGNFDFDFEAKDPHIPDDVKALSGVTIKVDGCMIPMQQADDIHMFALVPKKNLSPEGLRSPKVQQIIVVTCPREKSVKYCPDIIVVQGRLKVGIVKDDGFTVSVFSIDDATVKPASK